MNKRNHNEFCAEVTRRKKLLIEKKKRRQRVLLTCIPCLLCVGILAFAGLRGFFPAVEDEPSQNTGITEHEKSFIQSMQEAPEGRITVSLLGSGGNETMQFTSPEEVSLLLDFISSNSNAFSSLAEDFDGPLIGMSPSDGTAETESFHESKETSTDGVSEETPPPENDDQTAAESNLSGGWEDNIESETLADSQTDIYETEEAETKDLLNGSAPTYQNADTQENNSPGENNRLYVFYLQAKDGRTLVIILNADQYAKQSESLVQLLKQLKGER